MGSSPIALPLLDYLFSEADQHVRFTGIFTQPDRPRGRGKPLQPNGIKRWAIEKGLTVLQPEKLGPKTVEWIKVKKVALILVMAYGHILKRDLLEAPSLGTLNLHASILPSLRGASPIAGAIASGASETGVTLMRIIPKMDAGPILDSERTSIAKVDNSNTLAEKLALACVPLMQRNLEAILDGSARFIPQDEGLSSYTRKLSKADGVLDFDTSGTELECRIRALYPWPGCFFEFDGVRIKVGQSSADDEVHGTEPGTVLRIEKTALVVATNPGILRLSALQRPGGVMLMAADFLRGFPTIKEGSVLKGGTMRALFARHPFPR